MFTIKLTTTLVYNKYHFYSTSVKLICAISHPAEDIDPHISHSSTGLVEVTTTCQESHQPSSITGCHPCPSRTQAEDKRDLTHTETHRIPIFCTVPLPKVPLVPSKGGPRASPLPPARHPGGDNTCLSNNDKQIKQT